MADIMDTVFCETNEHQEDRFLGIRTNKSGREWRYTHELSLVTCISEASNDRRFEATVIDVNTGKRNRQTELTKPDQIISCLMGS